MKVATVVLARALALAWAVFWMYFFVAESLEWDTPVRAALLWVGLGVVFLVLTLAPWRWEAAGGLVLVLVGFLIGVVYAIWAPAGLRPSVRLVTTLVFGVPPILSGILFLAHRHSLAAHA